MPQPETTLAILAGSTATERVMLVLVSGPEGSLVELRQQSWGEGVGWFTQSHVQLEPHQVAELKQTLGQTSGNTASRNTASRNTPSRRVIRPVPGSFVPRVVHAESA